MASRDGLLAEIELAAANYTAAAKAEDRARGARRDAMTKMIHARAELRRFDRGEDA